MNSENEDKIVDNINTENASSETQNIEDDKNEVEETKEIKKEENPNKIDSLEINDNNPENYDTNGNDEIENNFPLIKNPENFSSLPNPLKSRTLVETLSQKRFKSLNLSIPTSEKPIRLRKSEYKETRVEHPLDNFKEERYATKAEAYLSGYIAGTQSARKGKV